MSGKTTPENLVLQSVCEYLERRGYTFWRNNTVGVYDVRQKRFRSMPKYSIAGVSDIIVLYEGKAIFIECKAEKGVQSDSQKEFQIFVENADCKYYIVKSIDDLIEIGF